MFLPIVNLLSALLSFIAVSVISNAFCEGTCDEVNPFNVAKANAEVQLSKNRLPFTINVSVDVYGDQESIKVNIGDALNSSFSVQIGSIETNESIGRFENWPEYILHPPSCGGSVDPSVLITTRPLNSSDVTFHWRPPISDKGTLALMGTFIKNDEYWIVKEDGPKIFYHLSRRKKDIPSSLMCYGSDNYCDTKEECGYEMIYELVDTQKLKIQIESYYIKEYVYLAVVLTRNLEQLTHLMNIGDNKYQETHDSVIMTCTKTNGILVTNYPEDENAVSYFSTDVAGKNFRCLFFVSLKELKGKNNSHIHYAYFWGQTDYSSKKMTLPRIENFGILFRPLLDEGVVNISCYGPTNQSAVLITGRFHSFYAIFIIVCLRFLR